MWNKVIRFSLDAQVKIKTELPTQLEFELTWTIWSHYILELHFEFFTVTDVHSSTVSKLQWPDYMKSLSYRTSERKVFPLCFCLFFLYCG